jgi:hypothetical protein
MSLSQSESESIHTHSKQFKENTRVLPNKGTLELMDGKLQVDLYFNDLKSEYLTQIK